MALTPQNTLVGWKSIAAYFSRDERTVMRWAADRGMPVQRVAGQARSSVYAWPEELDRWLRNADAPAPEPVAVTPEPVAVTPEPAPAPAEAAKPVRGRPSLRAVAVTIGAALLVTGAGVAGWYAHPAGSTVTAEPGFRDEAARTAYLQATFDWNLRTRDSLGRAIHEFGDAIGRDPGVAASYVGLANSYLMLREYGGMSDGEAYARAAAAARVATALSPDAMEAHRALAFIDFWSADDVPAARQEFAHALALAPHDALTHHWLATALSANGETAAAFREIATARLLDPTATATIVDYAWLAWLAGQNGESKLVLASLAAVDGQDASLHRTLASIAILERDYPRYLAEASTMARLRGHPVLTSAIERQAAAYHAGGATAMLRVMVDDARQQMLSTGTGFFPLAVAQALAGNRAGAIDALASACGRHEPDAVAAAGDPALVRLLSTSTIHQLCGHESLIEG